MNNKEKTNQQVDIKNLQDFVLIPEFISVTGSTIYGKHEPNDTDIVIRFPKELFDKLVEHFPEFFEQLTLKLERAFNKKVHLIPCSTGPDWDYIPLYDLKHVPREKTEIQKIKEDDYKKVAYNQELRIENKDLEKQAKESKEKDSINLNTFFFPEKTNLSAVMVENKEIPNLDDLFKEENYYFAQKKYDGNRVIIYYHKDNDENTRFISEDGTVLSRNKFTETVEELKKLNIESAIFDSELEIWNSGKKLNREDVAGYLHSKESKDQSGTVFNIFDILYYNGNDIHKEKLSQRLDILNNIKFNQSTIDIPNEKLHLNLSPTFKITKDNYKQELKKLVFAQASEGAMIKKDTKYYFGYSNNWVKIKKYETLRVIVLKIHQTKVPTVFNYDIGVAIDNPDLYDKDSIVEIDGKKYLQVGKTYNTAVTCKVGDIISIKFHTFNLYKNKKGKIYANVYEPVFEELHKEEATPDHINNVIKKAETSGLLVQKFIEDLYSYNPEKVENKVLLDDYRILLAWYSTGIKKYSKKLIEQKIEEVIKEITKRGIAKLSPENYRNSVISQLVRNLLYKLNLEPKNGIIKNSEDVPEENNEYKYVTQLHFRGKSVHMDLRLQISDSILKGWTLLMQLPNYPKKEVLTLEEAEKYIKDNHAKVDLKTGKLKLRKISSGIIRKTSIEAVQKADEPLEWLDVHGIAPIGTPGATANNPGVFYIWDKGKVEFGSFKSYFYEYFLDGNKFSGRYIVRLLSHKMNENILSTAKIPDETEIRTQGYWLFIEPDDQTPYILSEKAVEDGYISPFGYSYLPKNVRNNVPSEYQYWKIKNLKDRIKTRDLLVSSLDNLNIKFSENTTYKLFRIIWKRHDKDGNPVVVIRWSPSTEIYLLKISDKIFELNGNLLNSKSISGFLFNKKPDIDLDSITKTTINPGLNINPTKNTWCEIEKISEGKTIIYTDKENFKKFKLGNKLYIAKKEDNTSIWEVSRSELPTIL